MTDGLFTDSEYYRGPPLTDELATAAEAALGVNLPASYLALLGDQNGGSLQRQCFPTEFASSWAPDHVGVQGILGVGVDEDRVPQPIAASFDDFLAGLTDCALFEAG